MRFLTMLFLIAGLVAGLAVALILTGHQQLVDQWLGMLLNLQTQWPIQVSPERFLVMVSGVSVLVAAVVMSVCAALLAGMKARALAARPRKPDEILAAEREVTRLKNALQQAGEQAQRDIQQFRHLEALFTERLDKRFLIQSIVEAASRATSAPQADSAVSLWLLSFGNDTFDFEQGLYCDETTFTKSAVPLTEAPFAKVVETKQVVGLPAMDRSLGLVNAEKLTRLGSATALLAIPLTIENTVLGVLLVFCHPDVLQTLEQRKGFYEVCWNHLSLALAIAIQGELAITDRLTGVHSRDYFLKRFVGEIDRSNRYGLPLTILMIDVDNFKAVNDTLGHLQGDAVLKIVSKLIKKAVRAIDLVGRYGGEEFIVLLPETGFSKEEGGAYGAVIVAERVRKSVEEEFFEMQKPLGITVSLGAAVRRFPEDRQMDYRELIRLADEQLYRAKTAGKNRTCVLMPAGQKDAPASPSRAVSDQA